MGCVSICRDLSSLREWMEKNLPKNHEGTLVVPWESQLGIVYANPVTLAWVGLPIEVLAQAPGIPLTLYHDTPEGVEQAMKDHPDMPWHQLPWPMGAVVPPCLVQAREAWAKAHPPKVLP